MQEVGQYLQKHRDEDFWKEILSLPVQSIVAKHEVIKIEGSKLRVQKNRLILENIEEILDRELRRADIRNEMRELKKQSLDDLQAELSELEKTPVQLTYKFLIEKDKDLLSVFAIPELLQVLETADPELYKQTVNKLGKVLNKYPNLRNVLLPFSVTSQSKKPHDRYLEFKKLIQCKELNQQDLYLLETQYESMVVSKLKKKQLGKYLLQLWKDGTERPVFWASEANEIKRQFQQQKHY